MSDTWSFEEFQDKYHSLNGGFHSEEEFKTAIAILNESNDAKIGSLLPRYNKQVESTEKYLRSKNIKYTRELSLKSCNGLFGKVQILTDFPELQDFRTVQTKSGLGQLASQLGSEKSSVRIYREGEKKPKTTNLKKLQYIKDSDGKVFLIGKTGGSTSFIGSNWTNDKRYAAFEEIKSSNNLSLYQEVFPQNEYILKRPTEEEFFSPPLFIGRRKALKKYFEDCPAMIQKIEKGDYDYDGKETFLKIFEDYLALGCGK